MSRRVAAPAAKLKVVKLVRSTFGGRHPVVDGKALAGAAANADTVASMNLRSERAPRPAAADAASRLPVVAFAAHANSGCRRR